MAAVWAHSRGETNAWNAYEEEGLEKLKEKTGKRRKKRVKQIKKTIRRSHKRVSHTDPDAGHMKRPGKPEGPQYLVHEATDSDNGFIVEVVVTGGDSSDSAPYLDQIERINKMWCPYRPPRPIPPTMFLCSTGP